MKQKRFFTGILVIIILAGVGLGIFLMMTSPSELPGSTEAKPTEVPVNSTETEEDGALTTLTAFLTALNSRDYESAENLYGGSYETLEGYNPDVDPNNHILLLERACESNGLNCLKLKSATLKQTSIEQAFVFSVELQTNNGDLFEIGPCCGADEEDFIPVSVFNFSVIQNDQDQFQVLDLPPYTP